MTERESVVETIAIQLELDPMEVARATKILVETGADIGEHDLEANLGFDGIDGGVFVSFTVSFTAQVLGGLLVEYLKERGITSVKHSRSSEVHEVMDKKPQTEDTMSSLGNETPTKSDEALYQLNVRK